jgi:DNA invertase Pin-like site-specific DNA recombinase
MAGEEVQMQAAKKAAIYVRISLDDAQTGQGVARQEKDARALAERLGWTVAEVYCDNSVSAYQRGKPRPAYERLMADLRSGTRDAVVVYSLDRLYRQPRELEDMLDLTEKGAVGFASCGGGDYDLSTDDGRFMARMLVNVANKESAASSRRQKRYRRAVAEAGCTHYGVRAYGFKPDRVTLDEHEAAVIREVTECLIAGESLRGQCLKLNARSDLTPTGKTWEPSVMSRMLLRPRLYGFREHTTVVDGKVMTSEYPAVWPAILTGEQRAFLRARLTSYPRSKGGAPVRHLLSGLLICGSCGAHMVRNPGSGRNKPHYTCPPRPRGRGCVSVAQGPAESAVIDAVLNAPRRVIRLTNMRLVEEPVVSRTEALTAKLEDLARLWAADTITAEQLQAATKEIQAQMAAEDAKVAAYIEEMEPEPDIPFPTLAEFFEDMPTDERRDFIKLLITRIEVQPTKRTRIFNAEERLLVSGPGIGDGKIAGITKGHLSQLIWN